MQLSFDNDNAVLLLYEYQPPCVAYLPIHKDQMWHKSWSHLLYNQLYKNNGAAKRI